MACFNKVFLGIKVGCLLSQVEFSKDIKSKEYKPIFLKKVNNICLILKKYKIPYVKSNYNSFFKSIIDYFFCFDKDVYTYIFIGFCIDKLLSLNNIKNQKNKERLLKTSYTYLENVSTKYIPNKNQFFNYIVYICRVTNNLKSVCFYVYLYFNIPYSLS